MDLLIEFFFVVTQIFFIIAKKHYGCGLKNFNSMDHGLISTINLVIEFF
jgi:hypothetical protein